MKNRKNIMTGFVLIFLAAFSLWGCGASLGTAEEVEIVKPKNHLASWRKELPQDGEYTAWDIGAVRGVEIQKEGEIVFAVSYEPREGKETFDYWDISVPYQSVVSVNTEELYRLFDTIVQTGWEKADGVSLEEAGIAGSESSVFIAYNREQKNGEQGAEAPTGTRTILIGKEDGKGNYYGALKGSEEVVRLDQALVDDILNVDPYQYILKLPVLVSVDTVEAVRILSEETNHRMEKKDDLWKLDGQEVSREEYQALYGELLDIMVTGQIGEDESAKREDETRTPFLTLQFFRNTDGASDIEVKYYEYDGMSMSVCVNGIEHFLVERECVEELVKVIEGSF